MVAGAGCAQTQKVLTQEEETALRETCAEVGVVEVDEPQPVKGMRILMERVDAPRSWRGRQQTGKVAVGFTVGLSGQAFVSAVQMTGPRSEELVQNIVEAVRRTTFEPGQKAGAPACTHGSVALTVSTYFSIEHRR